MKWTTYARFNNKAVDMYLDLLEKSVTGSLYDDRIMNEHTAEKDFKLDDRRFRGNDWPGEIVHTIWLEIIYIYIYIFHIVIHPHSFILYS